MDPDILQKYRALRDVLSEHRLSRKVYMGAKGFMASWTPSFGVECIALNEGVHVCSYGKFGVVDQKFRLVEYPIEMGTVRWHEFCVRLGAVLVPVVHEELERVQSLRDDDENKESLV